MFVTIESRFATLYFQFFLEIEVFVQTMNLIIQSIIFVFIWSKYTLIKFSIFANFLFQKSKKKKKKIIHSSFDRYRKEGKKMDDFSRTNKIFHVESFLSPSN